jgi:hypothetical protein
VTLTWTRQQRAALSVVQERWRLLELARREAARERIRRRQRLAQQLAIALGWHDPRSKP